MELLIDGKKFRETWNYLFSIILTLIAIWLWLGPTVGIANYLTGDLTYNKIVIALAVEVIFTLLILGILRAASPLWNTPIQVYSEGIQLQSWKQFWKLKPVFFKFTKIKKIEFKSILFWEGIVYSCKIIMSDGDDGSREQFTNSSFEKFIEAVEPILKKQGFKLIQSKKFFWDKIVTFERKI